MKEKVLKKLITVSRKNNVMRHLMLAVIFVFLAFCHFGSFLSRQKIRFCGVACTVILFLLSSSFALPILLDMDEDISMAYVSDLESMMQTGELDEVVIEKELEGEEFSGNEDYDVEAIDTYSLDEILLEHEEYLTSRENEDQQDIQESAESAEDMVFSADDWRLILINKNHPIPDGYTFTRKTITGTMQCDERILEDLLLMLQAAKRENVNLIICSPYRSDYSQISIFERHVEAYMNKGLNYIDSFKLASQEATVPGYSEHQIGLSLDIYTASHMTLDDAYGETEAGRWLAEHCSEYGFILRYPKDKEYITSINYEPWHFRYVGREAAQIIMEEGITLEEFWEQYVQIKYPAAG